VGQAGGGGWGRSVVGEGGCEGEEGGVAVSPWRRAPPRWSSCPRPPLCVGRGTARTSAKPKTASSRQGAPQPSIGARDPRLAIADEAQGLRHLSSQDLYALSDQVEEVGSFEAAFRLRLRAIASEYEDLDSVVDIVRQAFLTRGIESVPLRLKRLVGTARFALTHAPAAAAAGLTL